MGSSILATVVGIPVHLLTVSLSVLSDGAYALTIGTLLAWYWLGASDPLASHTPEGSRSSTPQALSLASQRNLLRASISVLIITHLVRPWFLAASMSGSNSFTTNLHLVPTILSSTHQGALWYLNSVALLTLALGRGSRRRPPTPVGPWVALASIILLAFVKAASGHAGDEGDFTLIEFCQLLHVLSTAIWAGAILISGFLVAPRLCEIANMAKLWGYAARLSTTVTWSLATLVISGIYTSDRELNNSLSAVRTSTWGNILLAKLIVVAAAILLGAANRFLCLRRTPSPHRAQLVKRLLFTEALLMVCILGLSGLLGNTAPPMSDR